MNASRYSHAAVLRIALPVILSNLSVPLVGIVDTAIVGRLPGAEATGAIALGAVVFNLLFWGLGFLRMGTTGFTAQALGAGDGSGLRALLLRSAAIGLVLGLSILAARDLVLLLAARLLGPEGEMLALMNQYVSIRVWSAPAVLANYVLMGLFVGLGRTGHALAAQLLLNLGNASLSWWLALQMGLGIGGVAWASVLAEYLALAAGVLLALHASRVLPGRWRLGALCERAGYVALLRVNGDIFVRTLCVVFAFAWFQARGVEQGAVLLAANAILLHLVQLLAYGLDGFAHAAEALTGAAIGRRDREGWRRAARTTTVWALGFACAYALAYALFAQNFVDLLNTIPEVRAAASVFTIWLVPIALLAVWSYQLDGLFIGALLAREMRNAMLWSFAGYWLASLALEAWLGNHGLWLALLLFFLLRAITLFARLPAIMRLFDPVDPGGVRPAPAIRTSRAAGRAEGSRPE